MSLSKRNAKSIYNILPKICLINRQNTLKLLLLIGIILKNSLRDIPLRPSTTANSIIPRVQRRSTMSTNIIKLSKIPHAQRQLSLLSPNKSPCTQLEDIWNRLLLLLQYSILRTGGYLLAHLPGSSSQNQNLYWRSTYYLIRYQSKSSCLSINSDKENLVKFISWKKFIRVL